MIWSHVEILTESGSKKIFQLHMGDRIDSPQGWSKVLTVQNISYTGNLVILTTTFNKEIMLTRRNRLYDPSDCIVLARQLRPGKCITMKEGVATIESVRFILRKLDVTQIKVLSSANKFYTAQGFLVS
jgi:hypothetical protein